MAPHGTCPAPARAHRVTGSLCPLSPQAPRTALCLPEHLHTRLTCGGGGGADAAETRWQMTRISIPAVASGSPKGLQESGPPRLLAGHTLAIVASQGGWGLPNCSALGVGGRHIQRPTLATNVAVSFLKNLF